MDNPITRIVASVAIIGIFLSVVILILSVFELPFPTEITDGLQFLFSSLYKFDFIIPVNTLLSVFTITLTIEVVLMMFKLLIWVKDLITKSAS